VNCSKVHALCDGNDFLPIFASWVWAHTLTHTYFLPDRGHLQTDTSTPFYLHNPTVPSSPAMDDYQKHLERQLQQQQLQLRSQATDPNPPRNFQQTMLLQQQRIQPPQPQWTSNIITGQAPTSAAPGPAGFGRGLAGSPVAMGLGAQPQATAQITQVQQSAFSPSSQTQGQSVHSPAQPASQKSRASPVPGSPDPVDSSTLHLFGYAHSIEAEKLKISTILEINSHLIKICLSLQSTVPPQNIATDPTYAG
jgi:hypothetical protein